MIDFHTHVTSAWDAGTIRFARICLAVMDRGSIRTSENLAESYGDSLRAAIAKVIEMKGPSFASTSVTLSRAAADGHIAEASKWRTSSSFTV